MPKIGGVKLGELPRVVLGVDGDSHAVVQAATEGVDILEVRVDLFPHLDSQHVVEEVKLLKRYELPLIGTVRNQHESGKTNLATAQQEELYGKISPLVDAIDVDMDTAIAKNVVSVARRNQNTIIVSHHDFKGTPSDSELRQILSRATDLGADIVKIATLAKNETDVVRLLQFTSAHRQKNLVAIAMGSTGSLSRLVFPLVGSLMTYTSVTPSDGQIPAKRLIEDLRFYYPRYNEGLINRISLLEFA